MTVHGNHNEAPVVLIEEDSVRFEKPSILRVYQNVKEAQEEIRKIVGHLMENREFFAVSWGYAITWYKVVFDAEKGYVRSVHARFRVEELSKVIREGFSTRTQEDIYNFLDC